MRESEDDLKIMMRKINMMKIMMVVVGVIIVIMMMMMMMIMIMMMMMMMMVMTMMMMMLMILMMMMLPERRPEETRMPHSWLLSRARWMFIQWVNWKALLRMSVIIVCWYTQRVKIHNVDDGDCESGDLMLLLLTVLMMIQNDYDEKGWKWRRYWWSWWCW